jgi:hypothetical protein
MSFDLVDGCFGGRAMIRDTMHLGYSVVVNSGTEIVLSGVVCCWLHFVSVWHCNGFGSKGFGSYSMDLANSAAVSCDISPEQVTECRNAFL